MRYASLSMASIGFSQLPILRKAPIAELQSFASVICMLSNLCLGPQVGAPELISLQVYGPEWSTALAPRHASRLCALATAWAFSAFFRSPRGLLQRRGALHGPSGFVGMCLAVGLPFSREASLARRSGGVWRLLVHVLTAWHGGLSSPLVGIKA